MAEAGDQSGARPRFSELGADELLAAVTEQGDELTVKEVRQVLHSPFLEEKIIEAILERPTLRGSYEVRRLVAASPRTPLTRAMQLVPGLYWRDLLELARDLRAPAVVRRSAERYLVQRLPGMAVGERMALARLATGLLLAQVRHDPNPRVFGALLENPRLTEGHLLPVAASDATPPGILRLLAESQRWGTRYPLRVALSRNPKTPVQVGLRILTGLKRNDRKAIATNLRIPQAVRRRARVLLGEPPV